jgi:hypothetical protein
MALELTDNQLAVLQRLLQNGFEIVAWPLYASYAGVRKGEFGALLAPVSGGGMSILGSVFLIVSGNPAVRVVRGGKSCFVFKNSQVEATAALDAGLAEFSRELARLLSAPLA